MDAALAIALKDLRQRIRDRSAIILSVVAPFMLAYLFSVMIPSGSDTFHTRYLVVDLDGGPIAAALTDGPLAGLQAAKVADIVPVSTEGDARKRVTDEGGAAVLIPAGFSDAVRSGKETTLTVIANEDAILAAQVLRSVLTTFASDVKAVQVSVATVLRAGGAQPDPSRMADLQAAAVAMPAPIALSDARTADRQASSSTYYGASMAVLFVFFAAQFGVVGLLGERRAGTLARMLAAPIAPRTVLLGKLIVSLVLAIVSMSIIVVGTTLLLRASWGDPLSVAALIVATALSASGIALLVVGLTRTEDQASSLIAIVAMTLAVLGGSFFPMSQAPEFMTRLSLFTPHGWFLRGINDLASGGGIATVALSLAVLTAIGLVAGGLGLLRARRVVTA